MTPVRMYDTASSPLPRPPQGASAFAGYLNGHFRTYRTLQHAFPGSLVLAISVFVPAPGELAGLRQVAFDVERFDIRPDQINECLDIAHAVGIPCPIVYGNLNSWNGPGGLAQQLAHRRNGVDHQRWLAHPDGVERVPPGYAAKQYLFGQAWDTSLVLDPVSFFNLDPRPRPPVPRPRPSTDEENMAIAAIINEDGRLEVFVEKHDTGEVFHTWQNQANGKDGWVGSQPGRVADWHSLGTPGK